MAITAAICNSYKQELFSGTHTSAHTYKIALFTSAATLSKSTTAYAVTNEVSSSVGAGRVSVSGVSAGRPAGTLTESRNRRVIFYPKGRTETTIEIIKDYTTGS